MPIKRKNRHTSAQLNKNFFKKIWGQINHVKSFLENNLPLSVLRILNLNEITISSETFLKKREKDHHSDILYHVNLKNDKSCYIYIFFEHKNQEEQSLQLQLLTCMARIWKRQENSKTVKLFPIIPIVLYPSRNVLPKKATFNSQFNNSYELDRYIPRFQFKLCDLSSITVKNFQLK